MEQYQLSEEQKNQARIYFFEYICEEVEKDANLGRDKSANIVVLAKEEMPKWIDQIEKQIREDLKKGVLDRQKVETMDLGQILKESVAELNSGNHRSRE